MITGLASISLNNTFWKLSWRVGVTAMRKGVMSSLWIMPCPGGLGRTVKK
jgi:hypothetical protein